MDAVKQVEDAVNAQGDEVEVAAVHCDAAAVSFTDQQQCDLKEGQQDDGEVLLVQDLQDFQGVLSSETVVVEDSRLQPSAPGPSRGDAYQQYQPLVVQGFVTSSGEVVHVVQQDAVPATSGHRTLNPSSSSPAQAYQHHSYQPQPPPQQMMHPDLYRLIKMFPDFSTKTLHRIFVMCRCDLKRALDQALFARQFRQLDSAQAYTGAAPSSPHSLHFLPAPYRPATSAAAAAAARAPHLQMGMDMGSGDVYLPRGRTAPPPPAPILLYQHQQVDPRLSLCKHATPPPSPSPANTLSLGHHLGQDADDVIEIKLSDLSADVHVPVSLADGLGDNLGLLVGPTGMGCVDDGGGGGDLKDTSFADLTEVTIKDTAEVNGGVTSQPTVVC